MNDISISHVGDDTIRVQSSMLFSDSKSPFCQEFLKRVFQAKPVKSVAVQPVNRWADVRYCTQSANRQSALQAIYACLAKTPPTFERHAEERTAEQLHGHPAAGVTVDPERSWHPNERGEVRLYRHGKLVSDWQVKHELPGRMRLKHDALHRRAEVCQSVERELMSVLGVDNYKTNPMTATVLINFNVEQITRDQIIEILDSALARLSVAATKDRPVLDMALASVGLPLAAVAQFAAPPLMPLAAGLFMYNSVTTFKEAYNVLFHERRLGVDVLDAIVVVSCLGTGQVFAGSVLCWCLSFGRMLVKLTQDNSKKMLMNVFGKQPRFVWLCRDGVETEVALEKIQQGDVIVVNTGEAVPVDGIVKEGMAMVDQHALTGESTPAEKVVGDHVFASTMLVAGKIFVEVQKAGTDTTSAKIASILNDTAGYKLDSQNKGEKLADKAVVPTLALGALGLAVMGPAGATAVLNSDFGTGIRMAAPLAMLSSLTLCAQHGILVKDGRAMDLMCEIDTVLFDKTGTLTREVPEVGRVITCGRYAEETILTYAAAAENRFAHPIAKAIVERYLQLGRPIPKTDDSKYKVGFGITVEIDGHTVRVGSARFMKMEGIEIPSEVQHALDAAHDEGFSLVMVGVDGELGGAIELRASHRPEAQAIVEGLRARGVSHLAIISGDHEGPTKKLANSLGMDEYFAGVLPGDKANYVELLQKKGRKVCFVGDGINDSIALKKANVSVSLRGATSIATDTAQVVFMEESLAKLCEFLDISRGLDRNVKRSWSYIIAPNALCIAGAFTMGFGVMASVLTNNVSAIAALANGLMPLREVARLKAQQEAEREARMATLGRLYN
ncbi:MAG: heavy metal translocating P-type ATPase [Pirellulales bacterium]